MEKDMDLIKDYEEKLRKAMINSDVETLDDLISDDMLFVGPVGGTATKDMDISAHKSKIQKMTSILQSEQRIKKYDDETYVVAVKCEIKGTFDDMNIDGNYSYLRIWKKEGEKFRIIAGSVFKI
jgi:ketosteroid isomerase-like protein